uniref:Mut7-C RNAse domain-containing protein n=2 Tax=Palpitomonas bilix TaxID=652834 RepID=A0A7S3CW61_9EUKA|mmetsp:Transcript_1016/g.2115  ORF Transcript_1016/g.2115 Transcript_1016/m.2115 type:complete len:409 (+) Transcript_1016:544-1770(+)
MREEDAVVVPLSDWHAWGREREEEGAGRSESQAEMCRAVPCKTVVFSTKRGIPVACVLEDTEGVDRKKVGKVVGVAGRDLYLLSHSKCATVTGFSTSVISPIAQRWMEREHWRGASERGDGEDDESEGEGDSNKKEQGQGRERKNNTRGRCLLSTTLASDNYLCLGSGAVDQVLLVRGTALCRWFDYVMADVVRSSDQAGWVGERSEQSENHTETEWQLPLPDAASAGGEQQQRFIADSMLSRAAKWLRCSGVDVSSAEGMQPEERLEAALREKRVLLTRDRRVFERAHIAPVYFVVSNDPEEQFLDIVRSFRLSYSDDQLLARCSKCNAREYHLVSAEKAEELMQEQGMSRPPRMLHSIDEFYTCGGCGKVFWKGPKYESTRVMVEGLWRKAEADKQVGETGRGLST